MKDNKCGRMTYRKCSGCIFVEVLYEDKDDVNMPPDSAALICGLDNERIYIEKSCPGKGNPREMIIKNGKVEYVPLHVYKY
ncbi:hypothetical protein KAU33_04375 [Candidatus Dependentiae bacterium]|nr:hypothetical protein [Candidatus Dependentiae bacterium]